METSREIMLYEEYGSRNDYLEEIKCNICKKIMLYSSANIDVVYDEASFICKNCREKLP